MYISLPSSNTTIITSHYIFVLFLFLCFFSNYCHLYILLILVSLESSTSLYKDNIYMYRNASIWSK